MNKALKVASFFPSQAEMARVIGRDPAIVTRMIKAGTVPWHFNAALRAWAAENGCESELPRYLEPVCECCGRGLT